MNNLDEGAIRAQLDRILASPGFRDAGRIGPLLAFLVDKTLAGDLASLKESVLGVEVFQRAAGYDPRTDPIVRVDARRLRARLDEFYNANPGEPVRISLPKGGYQPAFHPGGPVAAPEPPARIRLNGPTVVFLFLTVVSFGVMGLLYLGQRAKKAEKPAIAVLPFRNLSADQDNQYFSDGLTIELIDALSHIENLRVISWNTANLYRGKAGNLAELRDQLNAAAVLDGSVRKQGDRIRVTAQLVDTARGNVMWSQTWEPESTDVFKIQEALAKSIVYALRVQMSADPSLMLIPQRAANLDAYNDYLRARYHRNAMSFDGLTKSSEYARKAIAEDPAYSPAYSLLAWNTAMLGYYRRLPLREAAAESRRLAEKAIELDPRSAEGHAALGTALAIGEWKFAEARQHTLRAIDLNPGSTDARVAYVLAYLLPLAHLDEAEMEMDRATKDDPLSFWTNFLAGYVAQQTAGHEAKAIAYYDKAIEVYPNFKDLVWDRGMALAFAGRKKEALAAFRACGNLNQETDWSPGPVEYALLGDKEKAIAEARRQTWLSPIERARAYALVGVNNLALDELEAAFAKTEPQLMFIKVDRRLRGLRGEPRFQALLEKIGLTSR